MEFKYKSGQEVRVRMDLCADKYYRMQSGLNHTSLYFNSDMEKYRGKVYKIASIHNRDKYYSLETLDGKYVSWSWCDEMLEPAFTECICETLL